MRMTLYDIFIYLHVGSMNRTLSPTMSKVVILGKGINRSAVRKTDK